ncbi:hypothetical protein EAG_09605 [Camponotus floridanus]|uniref:Lysosome-associated membrane glycoprotein 5 n=1 Tax=Camponotus floridanus TaxID=104421 RepID=E2ARI3_CAMFO|nr:hypothetical protein EAG_09605 [Camponotus floridanus]
MMRSLLLLCWAATIVSAGLQNVINNTSVSINSAGDNVAPNVLKPSELGSLSSTEKDAHVPSIPPESNTNSNVTSRAPENVSLNDSAAITLPTIVITTTSKPTTSTTSKPTTPTTTKPTTPTTTTSTTSTTKPTTTPIPSTTTPTPTPLPPPSTGTWKTIHKAVDIPTNSSVTGKCGKFEQNLTLSWGLQNNSASNLTAQNNFTLHFVKNETEKLYSLHHLEISLVIEKSSTDKSNQTMTVIHMAPQFNTGLSNSYRCLKEQSLNLTSKNETVGQLKVSHLQFQAFRNDNTTVFGLAKDCSFDTPDIVPITVGCALAGLVVVVLIAYLVGRRRSQSRGYLSM